MIITLSLVLVVLCISLWLSTMYTLWRQDAGLELAAFSSTPFLRQYERIKRLSRRIYYRGTYHGRIIAGWAHKKFGHMFYALFPSAQPAFAKRNTLAGLKEGPTSYFLMSISETRNTPIKKTRRQRKIV